MNHDELEHVRTMVERFLPGERYILLVLPSEARKGDDINVAVLSNLPSTAIMASVLRSVGGGVESTPNLYPKDGE